MNNFSCTFKAFRHGVIYFAIFGLVVAPAGAPLAQSEHRATALEEVVVTAQKREESLQDAPISLAVFGTEALETIGVSEVGNVAEYVPNLSIRKQTSSDDNYGIGIRGVVENETSLLVDPRVGVYVDGIYLGRPTGMAFDINDLERLEVLRGPQGTLYGRNTIGGAINIITAMPDGEFSFKQKLATGEDGLFESRTSVNLETISLQGFGDLLASFTYLTREEDGYIRNAADGQSIGDNEAEAFRVALRWEYSDTLFVDYRYDNSERDNYPDVSQLSHVRPGHVALGGPTFAQANLEADSDRKSVIDKYFARSSAYDGSTSDIEGHSVVVEWDTGEWGVFKSITGYREWDSATDTTDFGSWAFTKDDDDAKLQKIWIFNPALANPSQGIAGLYDQASDVIPAGGSLAVSLFRATRDSQQEQFSQEFQLVGDAMGGALEYTVGLFYFEEESQEVNPQFFTLPTTTSGVPATLFQGGSLPGAGNEVYLGLPNFAYGQDVTSQGLYGQVSYQLSDNLKGTFGLRYTEDEKEAYVENTPVAIDYGLAGLNPALKACRETGASATPNQGCARGGGNESWDNISGFVNFSYDLSELFTGYVTVSNGYTSGGFNARSSLTGVSEPYDEETLTNYEAGWKFESADRRMRLNGAVFHMEYEDRQISQFEAGSGGASSKISNAGEQVQKGLEMELTMILNEGWTLQASYGYLDADFEKFVTGVVNRETGFPEFDDMGNALIADVASTAIVPFAPKHTAAVQLSYDFEPLPMGDLSVWVGASYSESLVYHPQLVLYDGTDQYYMFNARLDLDINTSASGLPGELKASLWADNITEEEIRGWGIDFGGLGFAVNTYLNVRSYGGSLVYNY